MTPLELWGGAECSVVRIGDVWRDQTVMTGHEGRPADLDAFADLGLKALRLPLLWERTGRAPGRFDWSWADGRLRRLAQLGTRPILGLCHHGSGPAWTDLLDPGFATGLARFAGAAAERYPWVRDWTPVNEPLTTARFSALYGHWWPHRRDEGDFWTALLNQVEAVRLSMIAIRRVIPDARLIQTEDFGRTWGSPGCRDQARHDSERRLMTHDLLTGRVDGDHPFRARIEGFGLKTGLDRLTDAPCPPDLIGLNHYVTSDRYLDERTARYPPWTHGGNGRLAYADVEAVRVASDYGCGWRRCFETLWRRYRIPIAVTECHLGCEPAEQLRWLRDCWTAAEAARAEGVEVEAVTAWALLGAYDWDSLMVRSDAAYEAGAFALSKTGPVATGLAEAIRALARAEPAGADGPGWWGRPDRLVYPPVALAD